MTRTTAANSSVFWQLEKVTFAQSQHLLLRDSQQLYLEPRQHKLLLMLIESPQQPISRDQLIASVWQGRVVSDGAINRAVSMLRKAFYKLDPDTEYITTLPKLGYKLAVTAVPAKETVTSSSTKSAIFTARINTVIITTIIAIIAMLIMWLKPEPTQWLNTGVALPHTSFYGTESQVNTNTQAERLLYQRVDKKGKSQIWLNRLSDNSHLALTPNSQSSHFAALSPDGKQFAYVRYSTDSCEIMLQPTQPALSSATSLYQCPMDNAPKLQWHPDGKTLLIRQRADKTQPYLIYQLSINTGIVRQLTLLPTHYSGLGDIALAVSAKNNQLAVIRYIDPNSSELLLIDLTNNSLTDTYNLSIKPTHLVWLNNNQLLLSAGKIIYQYDLQQAEMSAIYHDRNHITSFALANNALYYSSVIANTDIWQTNGIGSPDILINSSHIDSMPRVSHTGSQLAFLSTRQGHYQLWLKQSDNSERLLTELPGEPSFVRLEWAGDDSQILISKDDAAYSVDIKTGAISTLLIAEKQVAVANWGPNDNSILYSTERDGDWQLWRYDLQSKTEQKVTKDEAYSGRIWQGNLYYTKYNHNGLWQHDLATGQATLLLAEVNKINWLNWQIDDNQLYYYQPMQGIYRYDLNTGSSHLHLAEPENFVRHFSVRQGKTYYVTQRDIQADIYRLPILPKKQ